MKTVIRSMASIIVLLLCGNIYASTYSIPFPNNSLIGKTHYLSTSAGDSAITIAKQYDIGFNSIEEANPHLNLTRSFSTNTYVQVPTQHILPNATRQGIVVNLPEMRMYYFPAGTHKVLTYPIGIGKVDKTIPITQTVIVKKMENPIWIPTPSIREFVSREQGIVLPTIMLPGPDNPLGPYAIYTGIQTYLIHSTIFPESIGKRASFGCLRMFQSDIKEFFYSVKKGIPVEIINSPVKIGWEDDRLYIEVHQPLREHRKAYDASLPGMVHMISASSKNRPLLVNWQLVSYLAKQQDGIPHEIGITIH